MSQAPRGPEHLTCPLRGKAMSKCCHLCPWWTQIRGANPQGGEVDRWDCAMAFLPMLMIEQAKQARGTQAATENMRNEIVKRMDRPQPPQYVIASDHDMKLLNGE